MAKKRVNQGRRVVSPLASSDSEYTGPTTDQMKDELEFYGRKRAQLVDISTQMESIFTLQQDQTREADRQFGIEKQLLDNLGVYENKVKIIALQKKLLKDISLEDSNIIKQTVSDYEDYNREAAGVAKRTSELLRFRKQQVPFEDKILGMQSEIAILQKEGVDNLSKANKLKLDDLKTMQAGYQALSKQEQMNQRIEKIQENISNLMFDQGTAAGQILSTLKDIITNPLVIFTGLLALGVQRYEEMRQRGNQLAEEQDRINKALAGAGPYQEKIIERARRISSTFRAAGEGFSSSVEGAVNAVQALESQLGNVDFITGSMVDKMTQLKLSIGLSDEESAKVLNNFMLMSNLSESAANNAADLTYQMSETMGLNPAVVFQDIAAASGETLAHFSGGATQIAKAAVEARRMGLTLQDVANISKGLLDFETSIEAEMEAQMLTGMDINFNKARQFAMNKQGAKAAKEVLRQVGGLERFQKMNIFQQEAIAKATGLTVDQLLKTNAQRERENKLARDKDRLVGKQLEMSIEVTKMMGKLDAGLTVMQEIAKVLGDLFLDVFAPGMKEAENVLLGFIKGDKFKTVVTTILKGIKAVMTAIVDVFKFIGNSAPFKALSNYFSGGSLSASNPGAMDSDIGAKRIGNAVKIGLGAYALFKLGTFLNPMVVTIKGMAGGGGGLGNILSGGPGKFYKGGQFMPGGGRAMAGGQFAGGRKLLGMNLGRAFGGASGATGTALGGTALGTAGAVLGAAGAIGSIGMGIYDVATLSDRATGRDRATAYGGLGGAAGGAATGALIGSAVPVIGTLLGAGIGGILGYFGGRAVGSMDDFRDQLDTARDEAAESLEKRNDKLAEYQNHIEMKAMRGGLLVTKSFRDLSGGMKELTGKKMKEFGDLLVEQGVIGRDAFAQFAKDGKITMDDMRQLSKLSKDFIIQQGNDDYNKIIKNISEEPEFTEKEILAQQINMLTKMTETPLGESLITQLGLTEKQVFVGGRGQVTEYDAIRAELTEEDFRNIFKARGISDLTSGEILAMIESYDLARGDATFTDAATLSENINKSINTLLDMRETEFQQLEGKINLQITNKLDSLINESELTLDKDSVDGIVDGIHKNDLNNNLFYNVNDSTYLKMQELLVQPSDRLARGGILDGPSHAQGGIATPFGEMEGGEAVINKRSTAMYKGLLSSINVAGGGKRFAEGGIVDAAEDPLAQKFSHQVYGVWTRSIPAYHVRTSDFPHDITPGRPGTYGRRSGYQQTPMALDIYDKYVGLFGRPVLHADNGRYMGYTSHSQRKRHDRSFIDKDVIAKDRQMHAKRNAANREDWTPNIFQNMNESTEMYDMYNPMRLATNPIAEAVANAQQVGAEWSATFLAAMLGGGAIAKAVPMLAKLAWSGLSSGASMAGSGAMQMFTGKTFLAKLLGGIKMTGGASTLWSQYKGVENLVGGKASTKDIANVFLGGKKQAMLKGIHDAAYYTRKGDYVGAALSLAPPGIKAGLEKYGLDTDTVIDAYYTTKGGVKSFMDLKSWFNSSDDNAALAEEAGVTEKMINRLHPNHLPADNTRVAAPPIFRAGGILSNSPVKKVNDMIMTADGQMIETHPDDNIIAKKGGITQKTGGGSSRVEELLLELIEVTKQSGDVYMDGAKVSSAINAANFNA